LPEWSVELQDRGPDPRGISSGHHVIADTVLRAGGVKARQAARMRAVGAKRRALHAAEHRTRIECVMAGVMYAATSVLTHLHFHVAQVMASRDATSTPCNDRSRAELTARIGDGSRGVSDHRWPQV
jgi:hypothetical protein